MISQALRAETDRPGFLGTFTRIEHAAQVGAHRGDGVLPVASMMTLAFLIGQAAGISLPLGQ